MTRSLRGSIADGVTVFELALCAAAFSLVSWLASWLPDSAVWEIWSRNWNVGLGVSIVTFWLAMPVWRHGTSDALRIWIEQVFTAIGFIFIVQAALTYFFQINPIPWWMVLAGTVLTILLTALMRSALEPLLERRSRGVLLVGCGTIAAGFVPAIRDELAGVVAADVHSVPPGVEYLGPLDALSSVVAGRLPRRIILGEGARQPGLDPRLLLDLRYRGVVIEEGMSLYENRLGRVCWTALDPAELLFSSPLSVTRTVMALQAVYTNLIGLTLLLAALPVLAVCGFAVSLFSAGPALERIECAGFQRIPFYLLRFRTRRPDGSTTGMGKLLIRLRLVNLPQLINIVRGEMSLFGPVAPRREFADRLCEILPVYSQRFLVKPGILGWAQLNLRGTGEITNEHLRLEYDLYYVKRGSPSLDLEIFVRSILNRPFSPSQPAPAAGQVGVA